MIAVVAAKIVLVSALFTSLVVWVNLTDYTTK
jgi:predicted small integral membrane protein